MLIQTYLAGMSPIINGVVGTILALLVVPRFLRARKTGEYIGLKDVSLLYIFLAWTALKSLMILPNFGTGWEALLRITVSATIPFICAIFWVKLTDRYGWNKSLQIRR